MRRTVGIQLYYITNDPMSQPPYSRICVITIVGMALGTLSYLHLKLSSLTPSCCFVLCFILSVVITVIEAFLMVAICARTQTNKIPQ